MKVPYTSGTSALLACPPGPHLDAFLFCSALLLFSLAEVFFLALAIPSPPQHGLELEAVLGDYLVSVSEALADFVTTYVHSTRI